MFSADCDLLHRAITRGTVVATGFPFDIAEVHRWTFHDGCAVASQFSIDNPAMLGDLTAG